MRQLHSNVFFEYECKIPPKTIRNQTREHTRIYTKSNWYLAWKCKWNAKHENQSMKYFILIKIT